MQHFPDPAWNDTDAEFPDDLCIHELFERRVAHSPHAIALIDSGQQYTYEELDHQANALAAKLRNTGLKYEQVVGCCLTHSAAIVICTLAILKAGGIYLLMDGAMPSDRLEYIIGDAQPAILLTDMPVPDALKSDGIKTINIHDMSHFTVDVTDSIMTESRKLPSISAAYLAYTSGSTGKPKGVVITHQATVNHAVAFSELFKLSATDRIPLMAPASFDMAIEEMIPPLISGCTLIISSSQYASMRTFTEEIISNGYTILNIPSPLWQQWTEFLKSHRLGIPSSLRLVIAGSQESNVRDLWDWQKLEGSDKLQWVAAYGTTETTVTSTFYTSANADKLLDEEYVPIGKPIANTYAYVLDNQRKPLEIGKVGELYIGGVGLARGYHNLPELTKSKFLPDPFCHKPLGRMYRTGDLVRYRPDGNLVWEGRVDDQMKLRGLRIEPGDIETALYKCHQVNEAIVVLQKARRGRTDAQLVAFITAKAGHTVDEKQLRQVAEHYLPKLMRPKRYIYLTQMPKNINGKTDRRALKLFANSGKGLESLLIDDIDKRERTVA